MAEFHDMAIAQFENVNALRTYPFADGASLVDRDGKELPRDVVVDVHMTVPAYFANPSSGMALGVHPAVYLTSMHLSTHMVSACFRTGSPGLTGITALSVTVAAENFRPYFPYRLDRLAGRDDIGGVVTFGDISFPGFPETYIFGSRRDGDFGIEVHPCCVSVARPCRLRRFVDRRSGESLSGDVDFGFTGYVRSTKDGKSFALSLEDGADRELASECVRMSGTDACGATPITSINGVRPDEDGNIVLWFH